MNIDKLLRKAESFLNADERKRKEKRKFLKHVIKKLKKHEKALREKLEGESDDSSRAAIEKEIALAHAHRKKGLKKLKELKKASKSKGKHQTDLVEGPSPSAPSGQSEDSGEARVDPEAGVLVQASSLQDQPGGEVPEVDAEEGAADRSVGKSDS